MKDELELKSKQIEAYNAKIYHLSEDIKALSSSLQEKEATAAHLNSKLQKHQIIASTPEHLLELVKLTAQMTKLEYRLQDAECEKQQAELERDARVQEMTVRENLKVKLHSLLGKLHAIVCHVLDRG